MLKKVLDNLELELQRYNSDIFQSMQVVTKRKLSTIKEQFNRIREIKCTNRFNQRKKYPNPIRAQGNIPLNSPNGGNQQVHFHQES